ncbi:MAG: methionine gamma-lyase family protein [Firmicutes bacterium]|uniref:Methionine gamma-lyase family protein n=1 Tax=Candidatus Stercoripulliclostridium pullicola TaxID=2840953 RepID=A0A940DGL5_9FIRM|nr:methionine gamma-lyase family protein [Candidatus Stercoripulliclostridium pullicola]
MLSVNEIIRSAEASAQELFKLIDEDISVYNQKKVLDAFRECKVSYHHFNPTTGYAYDDAGREKLAEVFAKVFGAEKAIVSPNIVSGTHALTVALFGLLKAGDTLVGATGAPYDTLQEVIGGENNGSLRDYGINYKEFALKNDKIDIESVSEYLREHKPAVVMITRSRGYSWRDALSVEEIGEAVNAFRKAYAGVTVLVDNCYGEFVEKIEPTEAGADVIAGSLIKNPGGGLAPTGGYIAGKEAAVTRIGYRLTAPSIGTEVGSYYQSYMPFFEGLFFAPSVVASSLKGAILAANALGSLGYEVKPATGEMPRDIICSVKFNAREPMISFIQGIQYASPVESYATPEPWAMPGYDDEVIMAAGTFVQGASIELSSDAPVREPYIAYLQGGLTYQHCKIALAECLKRILKG